MRQRDTLSPGGIDAGMRMLRAVTILFGSALVATTAQAQISLVPPAAIPQPHTQSAPEPPPAPKAAPRHTPKAAPKPAPKPEAKSAPAPVRKPTTTEKPATPEAAKAGAACRYAALNHPFLFSRRYRNHDKRPSLRRHSRSACDAKTCG